jgi:hypothetical protein
MERGPVLFCAFRRLAAIVRSLAMSGFLCFGAEKQTCFWGKTSVDAVTAILTLIPL